MTAVATAGANASGACGTGAHELCAYACGFIEHYAPLTSRAAALVHATAYAAPCNPIETLRAPRLSLPRSDLEEALGGRSCSWSTRLHEDV